MEKERERESIRKRETACKKEGNSDKETGERLCACGAVFSRG